jgi:hypothetical protein
MDIIFFLILIAAVAALAPRYGRDSRDYSREYRDYRAQYPFGGHIRPL